MNEIERAIIDIRNARKKERRVTLADGTQLSKEWISINTLELAEKLLRSELSRQENAPLTCEDVVSEAYDRGYNLGYSGGYQDGTKGEETE